MLSVIVNKQTKKYICTCVLFSNGFRDRASSLCSSKIVHKKDILHIVSDTKAISLTGHGCL
jgi:hypothetical protein